MNIVIVNTEESSGGAARAAFRLHKGLRRTGQASSMFVERSSNPDDHVKVFILPKNPIARLRRLFRQTQITRSFSRYKKTDPDNSIVFSDDRSRYGTSVLNQLPDCDIINLHWVAEFIDYTSFFLNISKQTKIVWTLHDMNPFTGGCHYDNGCFGYLNQCGACPQLGSENPNDLSRKIWLRKKSIFDRIQPERLQIVTPSAWLAREAGRSMLLNRFPITTIPNGLDTDAFAPRDKKAIRQALGISLSEKVVLFVAHDINDPRKGIKFFAAALEGLKKQRHMTLISIGKNCPEFEDQVKHIHLGNIESDLLLSLIYSAADVFVIPSLQDNLPNTVMESMACGTPVVGFHVGGIPDMVRNDITGLLVPSEDVSALQDAIISIFNDEEKLEKMSFNCRKIAAQEYTLEIQANRYADLYKNSTAQKC